MSKSLPYALILALAVQLGAAETPTPEAAKPLPGMKAETPDNPPAAKLNRAGLNSITGKLLSIDQDARLIRVTTPEGFNIGFSYDSKTNIHNGGKPLAIDTLNFGDKITLFYKGKDLHAT